MTALFRRLLMQAPAQCLVAVGMLQIRPMQCFVYVLGCAGRNDPHRTYVGWAIDVDRRLAKHNAGKGARSTRGRAWVLLYVERYATRSEAMSREWHLKRDRRFRKLLGLGHAGP
jgi:putative endonuclease